MKHFSVLSIATLSLITYLTLLPINTFSQPGIRSTGRVVVKYAPNLLDGEKQAFRQAVQGTLHSSLQGGQMEIWEIAAEKQLEGMALQRLSNELQAYAAGNSGILYIEPDYIFETEEDPNDTHINLQWGLSNTGQTGGTSGADIQVLGQWNKTTGSESIVTGIIDTGIDWGHEDLVDNIWQNLAEDADRDGHTIEFIDGVWQLDPGDLNGIDEDGYGYIDDLIGWDFVNNDNNPLDDNGHGTHVAGIIGARGNNGKGIAGVNWSSRIMALKAFDSKGAGSVLSLVPALEYARKMGANLTNNSWGGSAPSKAIYQEIEKAETAGMLAIFAAGNHNNNLTNNPIYPASFDLGNIICVGATTHNDTQAAFSNYSHEKVDIMAPGLDIFSTLPGNAYGYKSGTSMAAPFVAGAASLIWSEDPAMNYSRIRDLILASADRKPALTYQCATGGRVNVSASMRIVRAFCETLTDLTLEHDITALLSDGDFIWAGTNYGVLRIDKRNCGLTTFSTTDGLGSNSVRSLAKSQNGNIWAATSGGVSVYDGTSWSTFTAGNSDLPGDKAYTIHIDAADIIWIGTENRGLANLDDSDWTVFDLSNSPLPNKFISEMVNESNGTMWIATKGGLAAIDEANWTVYTSENSGLPDNQLHAVTLDSLGNIWIGTHRDGLVKFDGTNWTEYNSSNSGLPHDKVTSVKADQDGNIWVATGGGVAKFDGTDWLVYDDTNPVAGLPSSSILTILVDKDNNIWAGTTKGMFLFSIDALVSSFSADKAPCKSQSVDFVNTSIGGKTFEWLVDGVPTSTGEHLSHSFLTAGAHEISLIATNLYSTDTLRQKYEIAEVPAIDLGKDTTACASVIVLEAGTTNGTFTWTDLTGRRLGTQSNYKANASGSYVLTVNTVCQTTAKDTVAVTLTGDCVWPGDVTADGTVNMLDFLALGAANGSTGPPRSNASTDWRAEPTSDWPASYARDRSFGSGVNFKHADCDGNGTIDLVRDAAVIIKNAGYTHEAVSTSGSEEISLRLEPHSAMVMASDTFIIHYDIHLENSNPEDNANGAVDDVFGIAFTLEYDLPLSQNPILAFAGSESDNMAFAVISRDGANPNRGTLINTFRKSMDIGMVSKTRFNRTVSREMATLSVIVVLEDVQDDKQAMDFTSFSVTPGNLVVIDNAGVAKPIQSSGSSATSTVLIYNTGSSPSFPVEWLGFTTKTTDKQVMLSWTTAQESGQEQYIVQRSRDKTSYKNIAQIDSKKAGEGRVNYDFADRNPMIGTSYYRIQRIEEDGTIAYSDVERVLFEQQAFEFSAFPNPSSGPVDVRILSNNTGEATMRVFDSLGRLYLEETIKITQNEQILSLNTTRLIPGMYYLELSTETQRRVVKINYMP